MTILVAGSANLDFVLRVHHVPAPGETVLGRSLQTFPGGKGANQAIACARGGGADTRMLLALGRDAYALPVEASLREAGVALHVVRSADQPTGTAFIGLADDAENAIIVAPGANATLRAEDMPSLGGVSHLLLQLETPLATVAAFARQARAAGVRVVLNAAPAQTLAADLLGNIDLLIVNEAELGVVAGDPDADADDDLAARLARVAVPTVIVTLGALGCVARTGAAMLHQPGFAVEPLDTTAAGDTFCGALVAAISQGDALAQALRRACAAAALACTKMGAQPSIPMRAEVDAFLARADADLAPDPTRP
ncbi:MAG: ribokinase [Betaproteobacteria bacterium]|nr:ribokinase [Betaproteobacteria bacterium]